MAQIERIPTRRCGRGRRPAPSVPLTGLGALAAGVFLPRIELGAQTGPGARRIIDVHHHFTSPGWRAALSDANMLPGVRKTWTPAKSIEAMDKAGVTVALISTGQAGWRLGKMADAETLRLTRDANEYGAKMVADYKGRFGLLAALPLPDVDATLKEIAYALDVLKAGRVRHHDELEQQVSGRTGLRAGPRRAQPPQDHRLFAPDRSGVLRWADPESRPEHDRVRDRHDAEHHEAWWSAAPRPELPTSSSSSPMRAARCRFSSSASSAGRRRTTSPLRPSRTPSCTTCGGFITTARSPPTPSPWARWKQVVGMSQIVFGADYPYSTLVDHATALPKLGVFNAQEMRMLDPRECGAYRPQVRRKLDF